MGLNLFIRDVILLDVVLTRLFLHPDVLKRTVQCVRRVLANVRPLALRTALQDESTYGVVGESPNTLAPRRRHAKWGRTMKVC